MRPYFGRAFVALVAALLAASCTGVPTILGSDPEEDAGAFVEAWNAGDYEAMSALIQSSERDLWDAPELEALFTRGLPQDAIEDFEVSLLGVREFEDPEPDEGGRAIATYSIEYVTTAVAEGVPLRGAFALVLDEGWSVDFTPALLWPGYPEAKRFDVEERWLGRGTVLDRRGDALAAGSGEERRYPLGAVGGTTIGHLEPGPGKNEDRLIGASGLELAYDDRLAGEPTRKLVLMGSGGRRLKILGHSRGRPGRKVKVSLDSRIQGAAEAAFGSTPGGAVVLDPSTGDILAVVSSSPFDPNNYVGVADIEPFNRALSGLYPPGSALKAMTAAAALDTNTVRPSTQLTGPKEYRGVRNFESGEFGTLDFATALKYSVNTAFAQVALDLGTTKIHRYAGRFGFNEPPAMRLGAATSSFPKPLDEGDLMWGSIGQAQVVATPLQMATVAATIANDGRRMEPRIELGKRPQGRRAVARGTARTLKGLMRDVVVGGTGSAANVIGLDVAGKTGTAEVDVAGERKNHAWFICFAPVGDPKVAVAVVAEYGGVGGEVAAPLARNILTSVWPYL